MKMYSSPLIKMIILDESDVVRTSGYFDNELPVVPFGEDTPVDFQ